MFYYSVIVLSTALSFVQCISTSSTINSSSYQKLHANETFHYFDRIPSLKELSNLQKDSTEIYITYKKR
jgi:hypothetical protein